MTIWTTSAVLIVPAAIKPKASALAIAMGWAAEGDDAYSVPLSPIGAEPATHWGLHTWAEDSFEAMIAAGKEGHMPPALAEAGYPAEDFAAVMDALVAGFGDDPAVNFAGVCGGMGLEIIVGEEGD